MIICFTKVSLQKNHKGFFQLFPQWDSLPPNFSYMSVLRVSPFCEVKGTGAQYKGFLFYQWRRCMNARIKSCH